jgi:hypothetical protein
VKCPDRKDRKAPKTANMVVSEGGGTTRYGRMVISYLQFFQCVLHQSGG